jgi:hypothetical protein
MKTTFLSAIIFGVFTFIIMNTAKAQVLYGISEESPNDIDYLSTVEPATGNVNIVSTFGLAKYVGLGISSLDPINKRFFFMSFDTLYCVDLTNGNLLSKNKISVSGTYFIALLEFNCQDTTLYAISENASSGMDYLSKVDPMTGNVTIISADGLAKYVGAGVSSLDPINRRFFFMSADSFYNVNLSNGSLIYKNKISVSGTYFIALLEFNSQDTILYAISQKSSNSMDYLSTVDPMTGNVTIISAGGLAKYVGAGVSSLDPINKRFFFMSADSFYNVDLSNGDLINKNKISVSGSYFIALIEYDKACISASSGIENWNESTFAFDILPNPFSSSVTFKISCILESATLIIYNSLGQVVRKREGVSGNNIELNRDNLPNGIYFVRLSQENEITITEKLIVAD